MVVLNARPQPSSADEMRRRAETRHATGANTSLRKQKGAQKGASSSKGIRSLAAHILRHRRHLQFRHLLGHDVHHGVVVGAVALVELFELGVGVA